MVLGSWVRRRARLSELVVTGAALVSRLADRLGLAPANLLLREPLLARPGVPPAWDNVRYGSAALGYVDAMHQSLRPHAGPTVVVTHHAPHPLSIHARFAGNPVNAGFVSDLAPLLAEGLRALRV